MREDAPRVLVVGAGSIGERHLRCFARTGARVAVCEANEARAAEVAKRSGVDEVHTSFDEALASSFDAVVVATPAPLHVPMARRLAVHGCHLLVEKPLSTSLDGVAELQAEVAARGLIAGVGYVYRAHPALRALRDALSSGEHGDPVQVVVASGQHFPTYRPAYREVFYADRAQGGGALQDGITHDLNAVEWLVGPADRVLADVSHQVLPGVEVEDTVHLLTRHGPVCGSLSFNQYQMPNEIAITVVCTGGTLRCDLRPPRLRVMSAPEAPWVDRELALRDRDELYERQAEAFLDAVEGRGEVLCTIDEAAHTLGVTLAVLRGVEAQPWLQPVRPGGGTT